MAWEEGGGRGVECNRMVDGIKQAKCIVRLICCWNELSEYFPPFSRNIIKSRDVKNVSPLSKFFAIYNIKLYGFYTEKKR